MKVGTLFLSALLLGACLLGGCQLGGSTGPKNYEVTVTCDGECHKARRGAYRNAHYLFNTALPKIRKSDG